MANATYYAERHIYEHEGVVVPSVTQVLALAGIDDVSGIPLHYLQRAAGIGTAVHQACEFLDQEDLDLESLDSSIVGYVLGYQRFKQEHDFFPLTIEQKGVGQSSGIYFGYCLDRMGIIDGKPVLLDIKTSSKLAAKWAIQTAAYAEATNLDGRRLVVHVTKDGKYKLIEHDDSGDFAVWVGALRVAHWRMAHGKRVAR